jgi:putative ABC transport system ATP-binding protein
MLDVLEQVDLADRIAQLPEGLDTVLASSGWPLSIGEVMELKLANALLSRPRVLVLSSLFDLMQPNKLARALNTLKQGGTTVILFTGRPGAIELDGWLLMSRSGQRRYASLDALEQARSAKESARAL